MCKMFYGVRKEFAAFWIWYWPTLISVSISFGILALFIFAGVDYMKFLKYFFFCNGFAAFGTGVLIGLIIISIVGLQFKSEPKVKESQFITDTNGCQYFKKSERPRLNPNGTQICKPL